ncbi:MAG: Trm112 family protein [Promethearchaeota archaeon]
MKPWLFDILACPIDKHFPLKLYIFSFETELDHFQKILNIYERKEIDSIKEEKIIDIIKEGDQILVRDNIILERKPINSYLKHIVTSINEIKNINLDAVDNLIKKCFTIITSDIKENITKAIESQNVNYFENILPDIYFLNKIKMETEIRSGILFCTTCNRWYPIIDTIPQMLPDEYRNEREDVEFLKNNKHLIDDKFINQDLKPFNI